MPQRTGAAGVPAVFQPTAYTSALMRQLSLRPARVASKSALEIGTGSGVVMLTLLELGAQRVLGVDLEPEAVACTTALLQSQGLAHRARVLQGDMWAPCAGERFDLVAANLPQFPVLRPLADGRLPSWSCGGADGRLLVDRFLQGLPAHLAPGGLAVMTHNVFIDIERTHRMLQAVGLLATVAATVSVPLEAAKADALAPPMAGNPPGPGLHRVGGYCFADFHVLEISHGR